MGKELHVGAGVLVLLATCGRLAMKNGDVVVRNSDVLFDGARAVGRNSDVLGEGAAAVARKADLLGEVRHVDGAATHLDDLVHDIPLESAQFTAENLVEWEDLLGGDDTGDYAGRWTTKWSQAGLNVHRICVRTAAEGGWSIRCRESARNARGMAYVANYQGHQVVGEAQVCTLVEKVEQLSISASGALRTAITSDFAQRVKNESPCVERVPGEALTTRSGAIVWAEERS